MKKLIVLLFISSSSFIFAEGNSLNWGPGEARYLSYITITGKTGFITTPSAYCAPMGTLIFGHEQTFSTHSTIGVLGFINKFTFAPCNIFEFGFSKELAYLDTPSPTVYPWGLFAGHMFDSTPFFFHCKLRMVDWGKAALAFGQDWDFVPDDSGFDSRGRSSTTIYVVFTGNTIVGAFNFGFGKTFYFLHAPDLKFNFFVAYSYAFPQLDHRLILTMDFSNAMYQAGDPQFKVADEDRGYLNIQVRGILIKHKVFEWEASANFYDILDIGNVGFNASIATSFNFDVY